MSQPIHTLGRGCDLAPPSSSHQARKSCNEMPPMRAQFFYCSPLPLDDPLTALPPPTTDSKNAKHLPRPFSKCDNQALLEAWLGMASKRDRRSHNRTCRPKSGIEPTTDKKLGIAGLKHKTKQEPTESLKPATSNTETQQPATGSETTNCQTAKGKSEKSALEMIGCPCKGSHLWCRKKTGRCKCTSCPKAPQDVPPATQTHQAHSASQPSNGKQTTAESTTKSKSGEDVQENNIDQIKHSKHWEHDCREGRQEREISGGESKHEEAAEPEYSCSYAQEASDRTIRRSEEAQSGNGRNDKLSNLVKHERSKFEKHKPDNLQPDSVCKECLWTECLCEKEEAQKDKTDQVKRSRHWEHDCRRGRSERDKSGKEATKPEHNPQPECTCTEEELQQDEADQAKRSRHREHDCRRGRSERERSEKEPKSTADKVNTSPEKIKPATAKSKNKGKSAACEEDDEAAQTEKTKASLDQQPRGCPSPDSASLSRDQHNKKDSEDSKDEAAFCCPKFGYGEKMNDKSLPDSRIPSCYNENNGDSSIKRQMSEAETIFSGSCDPNNADSSSKRMDSEAETVFSGSCDKSKTDHHSKRKKSEAETVFSGSCDKNKADDHSKGKGRKESEAEIVFSGSCDNSNGYNSHQEQFDSPTRFGSCCDPPKQNDKKIPGLAPESSISKNASQCVSDCCTELERRAAAIVHEVIHINDQSQHFSGHSEAHTWKEPTPATMSQHCHGKPDAYTHLGSKPTISSQHSKGKRRFFGKRQADGTADHDSGLYDDSDEDLLANQTGQHQGDATDDKCTCESDMKTSGTNIPVARDGNAYNRSGKAAGSGTTGKPFVKLPARGENPGQAHDEELPTNPQKSHDRDSTEDMEVEGCKAFKHKDHAKCLVNVPVGTCRLHSVILPILILRPIYWSPLNDQYPCIYGTWFYEDTMCPVEPAVANQLEKGYRDNECWSQTWEDQLKSAIEVGPEGEEKIVHRLWPKKEDSKASTFDASEHILSTDPYCAARCFYGEAAAEGNTDGSDAKPAAATSIRKKYANSHVIYKDSETAYILKPSLCPSAYYGRRPLTKIRNGTCVGIQVVRGFNRRAWNKLYPPRKSTVTKAPSKSTKHSNSDCNNIFNACPACKAQDEPEKVTDLCLVVHGIGQKLSERMESFNFTYAVNSFRCEMKRELTNVDVKKVLREDFCDVMILPVNWRANLSFEDGGPRKPGDKERVGCDYSLTDISQTTIPRVRELISDVMLDIPYYMSGHKHKMIAALIAEANRIYRLWCKNNPEFHKNGRVHLISHSLGSVMAMEVLSKQPTTIPAELSWRPNTKYFDFQTTNCFLAGSPCAFFLLLESKCLVPRKGIYKPDCECENGSSKDILGDTGTFGCLAVDNLYNIMHCNDPIAYRLNACVDSRYSAGLKQAEVPDSSRSFVMAVSHVMKSAAGMSQDEEVTVGQIPRPAVISKMPSQMEMEVHDFTAEEMAEKKFCQMNENGQVDWILGNRSGMLANQYIDMLSAHSSYWNNRDFIRFLCVEIGRKSGKANTLPNMRARKKSQK